MEKVFRQIITAIGLLAIFSNGKLAVAATVQQLVQPQPPSVVQLNVSSAFVLGTHFDQESYAIVSGSFNNSCYHWRYGESKLIPEDSRIEVRSYATLNRGNCLMYLVPYSERVSLGILPHGQYQVRFINGDGAYFEKSLTID